MVLFGIRSPIVVEYEETCHRLAIPITLAISLGGAPRLIDRSVVVALETLEDATLTDPFVACAFAPRRRVELIEIARSYGLVLASALVDPTAVLARSVRIGPGSYVNAGVVIGAVSTIGTGALANRSASIGHHTALGDHVSIGPGATLAGNVRVGDRTIVGAGAVVLPDIRIGSDAIVAAGSVVNRHVPDNAFVAGQPATERPFDAARSSLYVDDGE